MKPTCGATHLGFVVNPHPTVFPPRFQRVGGRDSGRQTCSAVPFCCPSCPLSAHPRLRVDGFWAIRGRCWSPGPLKIGQIRGGCAGLFFHLPPSLPLPSIHCSIHPSTIHPFIYSLIHPFTHPPISLPTYPSIYPPTHPSIHLFMLLLISSYIYPPTQSPLHSSVRSFIVPSIHPSSLYPPTYRLTPSIHPSFYPPTHPSIHPLTHQLIYLFFYPFLHPSTYPPTQSPMHSSVSSFTHPSYPPTLPSIHPPSHLPFVHKELSACCVPGPVFGAGVI